LRAQIASLGASGRVALLGSVTDPVATLRSSDVLVVPSRHEGFPSALVEAMSSGLAVVAFTAPAGPREIITDDVDGILVDDGDIDAMADALRRVMTDGALRAR